MGGVSSIRFSVSLNFISSRLSSAVMSKPRTRKCAFCEAERNITKQHVFPNRLRRIMPRLETHSNQMLTRILAHDEAIVVEPTFRRHLGHPGVKKLRLVCESCNTGWIKEAEEAAFKFIEPFILGLNYELNAEDQASLKLFAAIMFSMIDLDDMRTSVVSQEERTSICNLQRPPPNWMIFLGRSNAADWKIRFRHHGLRVVDKTIVGPRLTNIQVCTAGIGGLIFHVVSQDTDFLSVSPQSYGQTFGVSWLNEPNQILLSNAPMLAEVDVLRLADSIHNELLSRQISDSAKRR